MIIFPSSVVLNNRESPSQSHLLLFFLKLQFYCCCFGIRQAVTVTQVSERDQNTLFIQVIKSTLFDPRDSVDDHSRRIREDIYTQQVYTCFCLFFAYSSLQVCESGCLSYASCMTDYVRQNTLLLHKSLCSFPDKNEKDDVDSLR